jgi:hypothetical protein
MPVIGLLGAAEILIVIDPNWTENKIQNLNQRPAESLEPSGEC